MRETGGDEMRTKRWRGGGWSGAAGHCRRRVRAAVATLAVAGLVCASFLPGALRAATPGELSAESWFLQDLHTGRVLAEQDPDRRLEPASLVKLMTVYAAFAEIASGDLTLDEIVTVSERAWRMGGSQMFIEVGDKVSVRDLLKGIIVQSGNDASVAIAEQVGGTEEAFVALMNEHAARLGMTGTSFGNSHGLPHERNYTTARDVATLMRALILEFPEEYAWHSLPSFTYGGIEQPNRNRLLRSDPSVDGGKTGYTSAAGYCLAVSANRNGMRLIAVVMRAPSVSARFRDARALFNFGYRNWRTDLLYAAREPIDEAPVWSGAAEKVEVGVARDLWVTVERRRADFIDTGLLLDEPVMAPLAVGQRVGRFEVSLEGERVGEADLIALAEVAEGTLYRRVVDWFRLLWY